MYKMNLALAFSIQNSITDSSGILQATKERQQTVGFIFSVILLKRKNKLPYVLQRTKTINQISINSILIPKICVWSLLRDASKNPDIDTAIPHLSQLVSWPRGHKT